MIKTSYLNLAKVDKEFIGIFAPQAEIQIPFNDIITTAEAVDLLISNKNDKRMVQDTHLHSVFQRGIFQIDQRIVKALIMIGLDF